jgi:hypothetical protein
VHLDVNVGAGLAEQARVAHVRAEAERAVTLGATRLREVEQRGELWVVLQDPDGNEFCLQ